MIKKTDGKASQAYTMRGQRYNYLEPGSPLYKKEFAKLGGEAMRKALQLNPLDALSYNHLGYALLGLGKFSEARKQFEHAYELNPKNIEIMTALGNILAE